MATNRRFSYIDFRNTHQPHYHTKNSTVVGAVADTTENVFEFPNGSRLEVLNIAAATTLNWVESPTTGWTLPINTVDGNGIAICQGSLATDGNAMKFTSGTDAFYIKVRLIQSVVADTDVIQVGFREAGTTAVTTTIPLAKTDYDHKAIYGVNTATGAMASNVSTAAGADTETTATQTLSTTVAATLEVRINADLTVEFYKDGVLDVLAAVPAPVVTTAKVFVPHLIAVGTGAGAEKVELVTWECGLQ